MSEPEETVLWWTKLDGLDGPTPEQTATAQMLCIMRDLERSCGVTLRYCTDDDIILHAASGVALPDRS
jgi:hypothetical protein